MALPPVSTLETLPPREVAVAAQHAAAIADALSSKYLSVSMAGGLEIGSAGFHLAEAQAIARQPPVVPEKTGSDGRNCFFLQGDVEVYALHGGAGPIPLGSAAFHGGEPELPLHTLNSCVSIRRVLPAGSYAGTLVPHADGKSSPRVQLDRAARDLLDDLVITTVVGPMGPDWAGIWKASGDPVTAFDMLLVMNNRSIGYLPGVEPLSSGVYAGELLDKLTGRR